MKIRHVQLLIAMSNISKALPLKNFKPLLKAINAYGVDLIDYSAQCEISQKLNLYSKACICSTYVVDEVTVSTIDAINWQHQLIRVSNKQNHRSFNDVDCVDNLFRDKDITGIKIELTAYPGMMKIKQPITHHFVVSLQ